MKTDKEIYEDALEMVADVQYTDGIGWKEALRNMKEYLEEADLYYMDDQPPLNWPNVIYMAANAMQAIMVIENIGKRELCSRQLALYELKNRRYGNSFAKCFFMFGWAYALGHLHEKYDRIVSLMNLEEEAADEPILDSFKDFLGYCLLIMVEQIRKGELCVTTLRE